MSRPEVSVVIAATDSTAAVVRALRSLELEKVTGGAEILVVGAPSRIDARQILSPASFLSAAETAGVPEMRALGLARARGDVVVFTEDSCTFGPRWLEAWKDGFQDPSVGAATGPVVHVAHARPLDSAVFFCEYAPFLTPPSRRGATRLAGNNFAIRHSVEWARCTEIYEFEVAASLADRRERVAWLDSVSVCHVREFSLRESLRDRLRFGLEFGQLRAKACSRSACFAASLVGPLILLSQIARLTAIIVRRPDFWGEYLSALPITLGLLSAWSVGEWVGWVGGAHPAAVRRRRETTARSASRPLGRARRPPRDCTLRPASV